MAKDPAFLFYPENFSTGTQFFSDEQVGKYIRLLMAQHQHGHLTEQQVIFICKSYDKEVMSKFVKDSNGLWFNERLEIEIIKRKNFTESRSKNREGKTKQTNTSKTYVNHMVNKDKNKDVDELNTNNESIGNSKLDVFESLFLDDQYIDQLSLTHKGKDLKQAFEECYTHHSNGPNPPQELWEWRQKLNTWLTIKKTEYNGSGKGNNKKGDADRATAQAVIEAYSDVFRTGSNGQSSGPAS